MKFQAKIFLAVLAILILTLVLNSVLSLASFEKLYVSSLISTYEMVGKNLKRKIEQSLRFGKPLDKFKGMNIILVNTVKKNPDISFVAVGELDGTILYRSSESDASRKFRYPVPADLAETGVRTELFGTEYVTYLPLKDRSAKAVGALTLTFSRNVVYRQLKAMAGKLGARWVLATRVTRIGSHCVTSATLLGTRRAEVGLVVTARGACSEDGLLASTEEVVLKVARFLSPDLRPFAGNPYWKR